MKFECKVMRAGGDPHEWIDAACFGWHHGEEAWNNDGPRIEAEDAGRAALQAIKMALDKGADLAAVDGLAHVCAAVRVKADVLMWRAVVRTVVEPRGYEFTESRQ